MTQDVKDVIISFVINVDIGDVKLWVFMKN